uniref:PAS domain-containing protein n=1 Tax=Timema monikensis TaxID=170555 RepID=A0A7R9DWQ8_9NEOP|nr:unnamed protein product [Timema monikensis]
MTGRSRLKRRSDVLRGQSLSARKHRSFLVANAQHGLCHIIYCSDGFCRMSGYSRAETMQRAAVCDFLHGPLTSQHAINVVKEALEAGVERHFEILYYRKDGTKFLCSEVIAPIKSEIDDICLYIINFEDLTALPTPEEEESSSNIQQSKCIDTIDKNVIAYNHMT